MVKYIQALSFVAAAATAVAASEVEKKQEEGQRELSGSVPTYWPTYWPTYFPTEIPTEKHDDEGAKETRSYSLPPPVEHEWAAPPAPVWTNSGESPPEPSSWESAPMWDDDGWSGWSSGKAGKKSSKGGKCSTKGGKVSLISFGCIPQMMQLAKGVS